MKPIFYLLTYLIVMSFAQAQDFPMNPILRGEWIETGEKWNEVSNVTLVPFADDVRMESGSGVMYTVATKNSNSRLESKAVFGDLKFEFEFLQDISTKASLQLGGGLEINMGSSWNGGGGTLLGKVAGAAVPDQNVCKAPGLWQKAELVFSQKNEKLPARLEKLTVNGITIYENVMFSNLGNEPSPIVFNVSQGFLGLRNIAYSNFSSEKPVYLSNIRYQLQETEGSDKNFEPKKTTVLEGSQESLTKDFPNDFEHFIVRFTGDLEVGKTGEYAFTIDYQGVCKLYIDGKKITGSDEYVYRVPNTGLVHLSEGKHAFELKYQRIWWPPGFGVFVSAHGFRPYALHNTKSLSDPELVGGITVNPEIEKAKLIRSFMQFGDVKRTAVLTVGSGKKRHFSFDLDTGNLLYAWKGKFADVTEMWFERGEAQTIKPLGQTIKLAGNIPMHLKGETEADSLSLELKEYYLDQEGLPTFNYLYKGKLFSQKIIPMEKGIGIEVSAKSNDFVYELARAPHIEKLNETLYRINDYYLEVDEGTPVSLKQIGGVFVLIGEPNAVSSYRIIW